MADVEIIDVYQPGVSQETCVQGPDYWAVYEIDEQWEGSRLKSETDEEATAEAQEFASAAYFNRFDRLFNRYPIAVVRFRHSADAPTELEQRAAWVVSATKTWHEDR